MNRPSILVPKKNTLHGTAISHPGKRKLIFKSAFFWGDILVARRVLCTISFLVSFVYFFKGLSFFSRHALVTEVCRSHFTLKPMEKLWYGALRERVDGGYHVVSGIRRGAQLPSLRRETNNFHKP